jgi:alcohol dehydrogenase class IV
MNTQINNITDLKKLINNKSIQKILILSGKNSYYKTGADKFFQEILKKKEFFLYLKQSYLPELNELEKILKTKERFKPDLILAIGGGCVMDLAKVGSLFKLSKNLEERVINSDFNSKKTKVLAIPTTAGSGAEVTSNAVIYIKSIKYSVESDKIKPDFFYLIPKLLMSSSSSLDATAGFDAISQSVESMFSQKSNKESLSFSKRSLKILLENSVNFINKKNINNAYKMSIGANLAGRAIAISKTIAPHALSYSFTTMYGIPHGHAVSLSFNQILKFNHHHQNKATCDYNLAKRYETLFKLTKTKNMFELDKYFKNLKKDLKLEQNFHKLGIDFKKDCSKIIEGINNQRLKNNPVALVKEDFPIIFEKF